MKRSIFRASAAVALPLLLLATFTVATSSRAHAQAAGVTQVTGTVLDSQRHPVSDAEVRLSGPVSKAISTASDGSFAFINLPLGTYRLDVSKGGFNSSAQDDVVTTAGTTTNLSFTLQAASLTSLTEIGHVSVSTRNGANAINTTPASIVDVPATTFTDQGQLSVNNVLNEEPGVTIGLTGSSGDGSNVNGASPVEIGVPSVRGGLPYETESLIDGHPITLGQNGFFSPTLLSPYLLQNVEVVKGPGATSPSINYAINGTINYRTLEPTLKPQESLDFGEDQYGGNFANIRVTGTLPGGRLSYAFDYVTQGTEGFKRGIAGPSDFFPCGPAYLNGQRINPFGAFSFVETPIPGVYNGFYPEDDGLLFAGGSNGISNEQYANQRNELGKIRYAFTPSTVLTLTWVGGQSTAANAGPYNNPLDYDFTPPAGYSGSLQPGVTNVYEGFAWGTNQISDTNLFETEFHTPLGKTATLLLRQYSSSIQTFLGGPGDSGEAAAPPTSLNVGVYGGVYFGASNYTTPTIFNGQLAQVTYNFYWENRSYNNLNGYTAEIDKQAGNALLSVSYDEEKTSTLGTAISCFGTPEITVPGGSSQTFRSLMGRAEFELGSNISGTLSDNFGSYTDIYSQDGGTTFQSASHTYQAPRLSLTWRPNANQSVRAAAGQSIAPPYIGLLNNVVYPEPASGLPPPYWTETGNSGDVLPETAFGFDVGLDTRLHSPYTVLSVDAYQTILHDKFFTSTTQDGLFTCSSVATCNFFYSLGDAGFSGPLYVSKTANLGHSEYEGVELSLHRTPPLGWGYRVQGSLMRAFVYDIPSGFYDTPAGPNTTNLCVTPNINFQSLASGVVSFSAISSARQPYSTGYAEINYRGRNGAYFLAGMTYYGPNNSYNEPAFEVLTTSFSQPLTKRASLQLTIYNVTNTYPGLNPIDGQNISKGAVLTPLENGEVAPVEQNVIGPSTARLTLHIDM